MNWQHVQLIFLREMRDQLRDRRTLFTITVLPLLLYPLLGMLMMQVAQFKQDQVVKIRLVGMEHWPEDTPLVRQSTGSDGKVQLAVGAAEDRELRLLDLQSVAWPDRASLEELIHSARESLEKDQLDSVLLVDPEFTQRLAERRNQATSQGLASNATDEVESSGLHVVTNLARDRSQLAMRRLSAALRSWQQAWVGQQLNAAGMNPVLVEPLRMAEIDTSERSVRRAMLWSKVLPFIMLVWALTGAFYPAIDLCAGEKERGTLETLLSSPARRREIVWGKLFTVATFSMMSALLNLLSMHLTAGFIVEQLATQGGSGLAEALGPLPVHAFGWLVLLLIPMSAFFSAVALAVAALARSTKEGQYYLMPLLLFTVPLVCLPMIPSLELSITTSVVPVSGAVFLVRALIEGRFTEALVFLPLVLGVTAFCCLLSIRWAVRQFESEAVMFSESERWNFQSWLRQLWRDRGTVASASEAVLCGLIILVALFFSQFVASLEDLSWPVLAKRAVVTQIGLILAPCLLMATFLTRSLRHALRLHWVPVDHWAAAVVLGFALHPAYILLGQALSKAIPIGPEFKQVLEQISAIINAQPLWAVLLILAFLPAICEELTFRGFVFGGLLRNKSGMRAVLLTALLFGLAHSFLQQSIAATMMGLLLGIVALRTGSVVCTIVIHLVNNSLSISLGWLSARHGALPEMFDWAVSMDGQQWNYQPAWITLSIALSLAMIAILWRRSEAIERLTEAEMA